MRAKLGARLVLATSFATTCAAVYYAHWAQVEDKRLMHDGVIRDRARLKEQRRAARLQQEPRD